MKQVKPVKHDTDMSLIPAAIVPYNPKKFGGRVFQGIPGIEYSPEYGLFLATWYGGGTDEGPGNFALLAVSRDGGNTWGDAVSVASVKKPVRVFDPGLWRSPEGDLYWYWSQSYDKFDGRAGVWIAKAEGSGPEGLRWGVPRRICNGVMMNKPTVMDRDGTWAFPAAVWNLDKMVTSYPVAYGEDFRRERFSNLLVTRNGGKSFTLRRGPDIPERSFDEHMAAERKDGSWVLFVRTFYGIAAKISDDQGKTWRPYSDNYGHHNVYRVGPSTRFFIRKLKSGRWLLVYHDHPARRCNLTAWLSEDEGRTWLSPGLLLDERINVSYPDGIEDDEGLVRLIYDRERYKDMDILSARFTEEDILKGKIKDRRSKLRIKIN